MLVKVIGIFIFFKSVGYWINLEIILSLIRLMSHYHPNAIIRQVISGKLC